MVMIECPGCEGAGRVRVGPRRGCYITTDLCLQCNGTGRWDDTPESQEEMNGPPPSFANPYLVMDENDE
jgi:hypothetical protein